MLKKTVNYEDFNGEKIVEDVYFNLSKNELVDMQLTTVGGLDVILDKIIKTKDMPKLAELFKTLILKAYGVKSDDGKRFIKSDELSTAFSQTNAFDEIYMELLSDEQAAADFVNGIIPSDLKEMVEKETAKKELEAVIK